MIEAQKSNRGFSMDRILIIGKQGQVAQALGAWGGSQGGRTLNYLSRSDVDLHNPVQFSARILEVNPTVIINAAAYTAVDRAELVEEKEECFFANALLPEFLASMAKKLGIPFIHFSTDYVFSGEGLRPWREDDPVFPLGFYGYSKLMGEERVIKVGGKYLIFRTSWVYSYRGHNFLKTMLKLGSERENIRVVSDQVGAPTYAEDLAEIIFKCLAIAQVMERRGGDFPSGIYHIAGQGEVSWYNYANEIFKNARELGWKLSIRKLEPILTEEYLTKARRPLNSRLDQLKLFNTFGVQMPNWQDSLRKCLRRMKDLDQHEYNRV